MDDAGRAVDEFKQAIELIADERLGFARADIVSAREMADDAAAAVYGNIVMRIISSYAPGWLS